MKIESSLSRTGELLLVECEVRGPAGSAAVRLVIDTGAGATTLIPKIVERIGYKQSDSYKVATVNFLRHFNFEVRPKELRILSELIAA